MTRSEELFQRAVKRIPGGVNSPVRAYGAIGKLRDSLTTQTALIYMTKTENSISTT